MVIQAPKYELFYFEDAQEMDPQLPEPAMSAPTLSLRVPKI